MADNFEKAVYFVRNSAGNPSASNEDKLKVYALYKQATTGDVEGSQPWAVQLEARAKWDAWDALKGKSKEDAKKDYIAEVARQTPNWESDAILENYGK